ncbi:MAG: hypothetical protein H7X95_04795 [Deltaproteobacteria bacterium]|nr:hypothetical protein [Deltaproteobacteria bacterium]
MQTNFRKWIRVAVMAPVVLSLAQCNGDTTQVVCLTDLSTTDAGKKVQGFIDTTNALIVAASEIDSGMLNACKSMARDLGIPADDLDPAMSNAESPGAKTDAACRRVRLEIDKIVHDNLVANARLAVVYTPSVCTVDADARLRCVQQCDPVTVTVTRLECTPGHAYGQCMASCMGKCTGSCSGGCAGSCSGTCSGTCSGNCNGACAGTCAAKNADGSCYGTCGGTCMGTCDGSCTGSCVGSCNGSCTASCSGTCEGECSLWVEPPRCTQVQEVTVVEECKTNCDARAHFEATCSEPSVTASYGYAATTAQKAALDRLVLALRNNYSDFIRIGARASLVVVDAAGGYYTALQGVTTTARQVGAGAAACVGDAITRVGGAASKVQISVNVSIAVSASVSAMGGVAAM